MDEDGVMHPMSFPPEDSDHENESHFYINSITGKPFKEIIAHMRQFPMEKAAMILANEIMKEDTSTKTVSSESQQQNPTL